MTFALVALLLGLAGAPEHAEVAFASDGKLWAARADGSERRLLLDGKDVSQPAWSPDGSRLAYVSGGEEASQVLVLDASGSRAVTPLRDGFIDQSPAWSPDGSRLAFSRFKTKPARYRSSLVVHDGTAERVLLTVRVLPRLTSVGEPDWSPDGSTIAYTHSTLDRRYNFRPSIRAIPAAGGAPRLLIRDAQSPDWSPDGTRLAFADVRDHNGRYCGSDECWFAGEIYTAAADGSGAARLTRNEGADGDPQWSPDGSRILFTSDQNLPEADAAEVYSIAADGSCLTWLTNGTPASGGAAWRSGTGARFDPGSCDPATRPALVDTPRLPRLRGGLWLGPEHRGLLLSHVGRGFIAYNDCARFTGCPEVISLSSEPVCRPRSIRGLATNAYRFLRMRGALVAYYRLEASIRVLSGRTVTSIDLGFDTRLADVRRVVRSLRTYTASAPPDRLAPPRIPGGERVGPGPFRRALRSFGPLRYAGC